MSRLRFSIDLLDTNDQIEKNILKAFAADFNIVAQQKLPTIKQQIQTSTLSFLQQTEIYTQLVSGVLAGHFGLPAGSRRGMVDSILQKVANNIEVTYKPIAVRGKKFVNGMYFGILIRDFSDILSMAESLVTIEDGSQLPWLNWLLISGNKILVSEHDVKFMSGKGRSGFAVMVSNKAGVWRVPPEYSGTITNNWLTRAFNENPDRFLDIIKNILEKELG